MFKLKTLVLKVSLRAVNTGLGLRLTVSTCYKISTLDISITDYFMQTSVLVPNRSLLYYKLSCAQLPEILCSLGTDIVKKLKSYSSYFLFVTIKIKKDNRIVFCSQYTSHDIIFINKVIFKSLWRIVHNSDISLLKNQA